MPSTKPATTNAAASDRKLRRARPAASAPSMSSAPKTAIGTSMASATAIGSVIGRHSARRRRDFSYPPRLMRPVHIFLTAAALGLAAPAAALAAAPSAVPLSRGWEVRTDAGRPRPSADAAAGGDGARGRGARRPRHPGGTRRRRGRALAGR